MMKRAIIVTRKLQDKPTLNGDYIGVENGITYLKSQNIKIHKAMCDLDSVAVDQRQQILNMPTFIHKSDQIISDGEYAILWALKHQYQEIYLFTGGTRLDMDIHTFNLVLKYNVIAIVNDKHLIVKLKYGLNKIKPITKNAFFNIFAFSNTLINLKNVRYEVENYQVKKYDTRLVSNEFINDQVAEITVLNKEAQLILTASPIDR